ncbi:MAG: thioesterase family protein [Phycisphaeraceae bacterium]
MKHPDAGKPVSLTIDVRVRYNECDPQGVAHHASYPVWLEIARTDLLRAQGMAYKDLEAQGILFVVARMNLRYQRPARYDDVLSIDVTLEPSGGVKLVHGYMIRRGDEVVAKAETTLACIDQAGKLRPVPKGLLGED